MIIDSLIKMFTEKFNITKEFSRFKVIYASSNISAVNTYKPDDIIIFLNSRIN